MPQSDTWPGGTGLELIYGMENAGSCDSVVSAHSGSSDDSLDHLSAEEKACLMFLEETIDSLDTEEDSGLSNDEQDQRLIPGSLAAKLADLSASMSKTKIKGSDGHAYKKNIKDNAETKLINGYLVPTPFVVANSSKTFSSLPPVTSINSKSGHKDKQKSATFPAATEARVEVPSSSKPLEYSGRTGDGSLQRGPLSYEALVHLRKSASTKKTPLCPTIDHTIESSKPTPTLVASNLINIPRAGYPPKEVPKLKTSSPPMLPKAQIKHVRVPEKAPKEFMPTDSSDSLDHAKDPQVVRQEALQKLGLLGDKESENDALPPLPQSVNPMPNRFTRDPSNSSTSRSSSFSYPQATEPKNRSQQSSTSFHRTSRRDQQPVSSSNPEQPAAFRKTGTERSATLDDRRSSENGPQRRTSAKPSKTGYTSTNGAPKKSKSQPASQNPSDAVGYTVMVVPGMGADRKEALRKLGLLKN